jgi:hypothetical protein
MQLHRLALATTATVALLAAGCSSDDGADPATTGVSTQPSSHGTATSPGDATSPEKDDAASSGGSGAPAVATPGPDLPAHPKTQSRVLDALDGSATARCVSVGKEGDLRSGPIAMGNFARARADFADQADSMEQPLVHFYVIPQHLRGAAGASVTLTPVGGGDARTVRVHRLESADVWKYYAVSINIPAAGSYRMTVRSGDDRGCFLVDFTR